MKVSITPESGKLSFTGENSRGGKVFFSSEEGVQAVSPVEALLMSSAVCAAMDFTHILEKMRQPVSRFWAEAEGVREKINESTPFRSITLHFFAEGEAAPEKCIQAMKLSVEKYCSVLDSLRKDCEVGYTLTLNGSEVYSGKKPTDGYC